MISFIRKVSKYLLGTDDSELTTDGKEFSAADLLSSLEQNSQSGETSVEKQINLDESQDPLKDSFCCYRVGTVTQFFSDYALIDDEVFCDLQDPACRNLQLGNILEYLAFRLRPCDEWRVKKVYSIQNDNWENIQPVVEHRETLSRSIVSQVREREGRNVIISDTLKFNLDVVPCEFIPVKGDWLRMSATVEVDGNTQNLEGEILHVFSVCALRSRVVKGRVTHYDNTGSGLVNNSIFFIREVCEPGYVPDLDDEVLLEAIESTKDSILWRAISMIPVQTGKKGENINATAITDHQEPSEKSLTVNGVMVTPATLCSGDLMVGEEKEVIVTLLNTEKTLHIIKFCQFLSQKSWSQLSLMSPSLDKTIKLFPGKPFLYYFKCHGKYVGCHTEKFRFVFKGFKIEVPVEVTVNNTVDKTYQSVSTSVKSRFDLFDAIKKETATNRTIISGVRPKKVPPFVPVRIRQYPVPKYLWQFVHELQNKKNNSIEARQDLRTTVPSFSENLNFQNYQYFFHTLLYLEEIEETLKMRQYDLKNVTFRFAGPGAEFLALEVPGLAEKRPSLLVGDKVIAECSRKKGLEYEGFVHEVFQREVWLKFNKNFHLAYNEEEYDVTFQLCRSGFMKCHAAVDLSIKNLGPEMLFPVLVKLKSPQLQISDGLSNHRTDNTQDVPQRKIQWINKNLNIYQKEAVLNILKGESRPLPYVIFGPPGTGKTVTLVEVILQLFHLLPDSRMVVATPSNSSANLLAQRLLESQLLYPGDMVRLVGYRYSEEGGIPYDLIPYCLCPDIDESDLIGRHRITVGTCVSLGKIVTAGLPPGHFTHVLVDEAGQALEPEILIPVSGCLDKEWGQVVLAGDPQQLGPVVSSATALQYGLGESYLSRLLQCAPYLRDTSGFPNTGYNPYLVTKLLFNYRSLPDILSISNKMFYNNELISQICSKESEEAKILNSIVSVLPSCEFPPAVVFHGVIGTNYQDADCPSWYNPEEIVIVTSYIQKLYNLGMTNDQIGIITPYQRQVKRLREVLKQLEIPVPKIGSVEEFQGQERMVTILSAVRSIPEFIQEDVRHALGFVASPRRLNVAITRARALLVIVGNPVLLSCDPCWRVLVSTCVNRGSYIGCDYSLSFEGVSDYPDK